MTYTPVVIIGAPRSGTNMLRDVLTSFPGVATWPCDEINYVWRVGNINYPTDELSEDLVTPEIRRRIRKSFDWVARKYGANYVVEKTCANSLRVPFVESVLNDPQYVYIVRDGIDATASAEDRWRAPLDIPYLAKKARFVPKRDLPVYAYRYVSSRLARTKREDRSLSTWGPKFDGLEEAVRTQTTMEVAARQWQACVDAADEAFESIPASRVHRVVYEELVSDPTQAIRDLVDSLGWTVSSEDLAEAVAGVTPSSVGKGRSKLTDDQLETLESQVGATLKRHGYGS